MITRILALGALVLALSVPAALAAQRADDPQAAVKADVATLLADAKTKHDTLLADAAKVTSDAQGVAAGAKRADVRAMLKADLMKLRSDRQSLLAVVQADRAQLQSDLQALRAAKGGSHALRALLEQARQAVQTEHAETMAAVQAAKQAVAAAVSALKK